MICGAVNANVSQSQIKNLFNFIDIEKKGFISKQDFDKAN